MEWLTHRLMNEWKKGRSKKGHVELLTSVQLTGVGLVFLHDLSDLLSFQRRVENLVQPGVSLPAVDKVHELVQRDKRLPLGATGAKTKGCSEFVLSLRWRETVESECSPGSRYKRVPRFKNSIQQGSTSLPRWSLRTFPQRCFVSRVGGRGCPGISGRLPMWNHQAWVLQTGGGKKRRMSRDGGEGRDPRGSNTGSAMEQLPACSSAQTASTRLTWQCQAPVTLVSLCGRMCFTISAAGGARTQRCWEITLQWKNQYCQKNNKCEFKLKSKEKFDRLGRLKKYCFTLLKQNNKLDVIFFFLQ